MPTNDHSHNFFKNLAEYFRPDNTIRLSRINSVEFLESGAIRKTAGPNFYRKFRKFHTQEAIHREVKILKILESEKISPRIFSIEKDAFTMEYLGVPITKENLPSNWLEQTANILKILDKHQIIHRDIKQQNLLVLDGQIYIIDFGWSLIKGQKFFLSPRDLCKRIPKEMIYNNFNALNTVVNGL
jgi:tRNA A-37 threonylcarbamoyl transferase component Bud32